MPKDKLPPFTERFFKIRRKSDGLYSDGGERGRFSKRGKVWRTLGALRNHMNYKRVGDYEGCDIIEFQTVQVAVTPAEDELTAARQRRIDKEKKYQDYVAQVKRERDLAQLEALKKAYPDA